MKKKVQTWNEPFGDGGGRDGLDEDAGTDAGHQTDAEESAGCSVHFDQHGTLCVTARVDQRDVVLDPDHQSSSEKSSGILETSLGLCHH